MTDEPREPVEPMEGPLIEPEPLTDLSRCWDNDLDGWCHLCHGDPDRCPRTAR